MGRRIGTLGLVNYRKHPTDNRYKVFSFYKQEEADYFQELLEKDRIWFERDAEQVKKETLHLFGVEEKDVKKAQKANYMVSARFRKKIISNTFLRYTLLIIVFGAIALGLIGYVKNKQKLQEKTEQLELNDVN